MSAKHQEDHRAIRRQFLEIVARRQLPGAGSALAALDKRGLPMDWYEAAHRALEGVLHATGGAVAANAYAPERATQDIDFVVVAADSERTVALLRRAGWRKIGSLVGIKGSSWMDADGHDLDLIEIDEPWGVDALQAAQSNIHIGMPTLTLPYLVWMKLSASRTIDLADVSRMLGRASPEQVTEARSVVTELGTSDDAADFDQLVQMGRLERSRETG